MNKALSMLMCILLVLTIVASGGVAFAQDVSSFAQMTVEEQYEYLQTLSHDDAQAALALLSEDQLAALDAYEKSVETPPAESEPEPEPAPTADNKGFTDMSPQEQYEYLQTLSQDEAQAALAQLSEDQLAALDAYKKSVETPAASTLAAGEKSFTEMTPQEQHEYLQTLSEDEAQLALAQLTAEQLAVLDAYEKSLATTATTASDQKSFADMTPQEQYEYLQTLSDEDAKAALAQLSEAQLAALEAYRASLAGGGTAPGTDETGFENMTAEELYTYMMSLPGDEEKNAFMDALSDEQYNALDAYILSLSQATEPVTPALNYTHAAPFKDPVYVDVLKRLMAKTAAAQTLAATETQDALVLGKTVSGSDGNYTLTIDAYATGDVSITTGQTPVPTDIILVLDVSLTMGYDMNSGYSQVTPATNLDAYNYNETLYVGDSGQYGEVTITRVKSQGKYQYTYKYTLGGTLHTVVTDNDASGDAPPSTLTFYTMTTVTRLSALKTAANNFIDSIEQKANGSTPVDHRIAVVKYSTTASIISGSNTANHAFVSAKNNTSGINTLQSAINGLSAVEYTRADLGLQMAGSIFAQDLPTVSGPRNRVVVFFTDGAPSGGNQGAYQESVANPAVANAKTLKAATSASGYGATVYSIGIFDDANPTTPISSASNENKFLHFVSSNYPNATSMTNYGSGSNAGYYLSASSTTGLNNIFQSISQNIETGGTTVTLGTTSVVKDVIAPYFQLPAGATASDIHVYTSEVNTSTGAWLPRQAFSGTVTISADRRTIGVSGFSYKDNYYAAITTDGTITGYKGKKLIFEIPIQYIQGSCFGGTVPTNQPASGVYDGDFLVKALPIPTVDIPVNYNYTPVDQSIYLTRNGAIDGLFTTAAGYVADGVNNAYVNIVYKVKTAGDVVLGTYTIPAGQTSGSWDISYFALENLTANTAYTVGCTVTPVGSPVVPGVYSKTATVYVWKPEVTFRDSVIYLGETANYGDNFASMAWKNAVLTAPAPAGVAPTLTYQYTPIAAAFTADTHVGASVFIGGTNISGNTTFAHETCTVPGCAFNPSLGRFMVHVKTCSLTVTKTGAADSTDTFLFNVSGGGVALQVSVQGNNGTTIIGLPVGVYTVTEASGWSWRYSAPARTATLSKTQPSGSVTVSNSVTDNKWLAGDSRAANYFTNAH